MKRSRLKNIINKSKELSNKTIGESSFDKFKKSLPIEVDDNYRLESAWKAYGKPKDYKEALWQGLIQPIDEDNIKLPSIGYNEETDEYEYLNKGRENETVAKDIRVWDNDVIPLVKELKQGGFIRIYDDEKDCWVYKKGGKIKVQIADGSGTIEIDTPDSDQKAGRKPIGKKNGKNLYLNGDGKAVYAENTKENPEQTRWLQKGGKQRNLEDLVQYARKENPRFMQRFNEEPKAAEFKDKKGETQRGSHVLGYTTADGYDIVFPNIQEDENGNLKYYENWREALENAIKNKDILFLNPGEGEIFTSNYKKSAFIKPYIDKWNSQFSDQAIPIGAQAFKQGGQMNVIPEVFKQGGAVIPSGSLHAHKNHMELASEGIVTPKGIPVISEENGEIQQQAEIEREEVIFDKQATTDIEKLYKKFNETDKESEKNEIAIKAGKILTDIFINNTEDNTGLIEKVAKKNNLKYNK